MLQDMPKVGGGAGGSEYSIDTGEFTFPSSGTYTLVLPHKPKFLRITGILSTSACVDRVLDDTSKMNTTPVSYTAYTSNTGSTWSGYGSSNTGMTWDGDKTVTLARVTSAEGGVTYKYFMYY